MLRFHSLAWLAALALAAFVVQESPAQKRGGGGHASVGHASSVRSAPHISAPAHINSAPRAASNFTAPHVNNFAAPRAGTNLGAPHLNANAIGRPSANYVAPHLNANAIGRPGANNVAPHLNGNLGNSRPSAALSQHNQLQNFNNNRFDGNNRFNDRRFDNHHFDGDRNGRFLSNFFWFSPGFGFWPWNAFSPYYNYNSGYPYFDSYAYGPALMPYADTYNPGPGIAPIAPLPQAMDTSAQIDVLVPDPDTQVWFDGNQTTSRGPTRYFDSPALQPGGNYTYTLRAVWNQNGQPVSAETSVRVTAGSQAVVDFNQSPPKVTMVR
jgi:uncharacterized protein (TIGR03000 family)